jgi:hypothetical protein
MLLAPESEFVPGPSFKRFEQPIDLLFCVFQG